MSLRYTREDLRAVSDEFHRAKMFAIQAREAGNIHVALKFEKVARVKEGIIRRMCQSHATAMRIPEKTLLEQFA